MSAPASTGTDTMKPLSTSSSLNSALMNGAIAPLSTQTAKQKSK